MANYETNENGNSLQVFQSVVENLNYSSDKLFNLEILLMELASRSTEIESLSLETDDLPDEPVQNALEFDVLAGVLFYEIMDIECSITLMQEFVVDFGQRFVREEGSREIEQKISTLESNLKDLQGVFSEIKKESEKLEKKANLIWSKSGSGEPNLSDGKITNNELRNYLEMLDQSLKKEIEYDKRLNETNSIVEELKLKLHRAERGTEFLEESMEKLLERTFQVENSSVVMLGISKNLSAKLNSVQQVNILRVSSLEKRLQESRAKCEELTESNVRLNKEIERANFLERNLKDTDTQLEHARASLDAIVEQQNMLKSTMFDMENLIEDLKGKVLKAETRADLAESKSNLLTETNLEMNEELGFLRSKVEIWENSLSQEKSAKIATAKDIGIKTKVIADLVTKLALERERLHLQIVTLTKKNNVLTQKLKAKDYTECTMGTGNKDESGFSKLNEVILTESSSTNTEVKLTKIGESDESGADSNPEAVRDIGLTRPGWKNIFIALFFMFISFAIYFIYQEGIGDEIRSSLSSIYERIV